MIANIRDRISRTVDGIMVAVGARSRQRPSFIVIGAQKVFSERAHGSVFGTCKFGRSSNKN